MEELIELIGRSILSYEDEMMTSQPFQKRTKNELIYSLKDCEKLEAEKIILNILKLNNIIFKSGANAINISGLLV